MTTLTALAAAPLSYLEFHLLFILPPLALLLVLASYPLADRPVAAPAGIALLVAVAVLYTTPWDSHLIDTGVWFYGEGTVLVRLWQVPLGEYLFFALQPLLTGLWLCRLDTRSDREFGIPLGHHALGLLGGGLVSGAGLLLLSEGTYYLATLLIWAGPVLAIQWAFAWPVLWDLRRTLAIGIGVPTAYLWVADRIAIELGIWLFDETYLTGVAVAGLPFEEMLFFLLTNTFVVQGLLLFWWVTDRWPQVTAGVQRFRTRLGAPE